MPTNSSRPHAKSRSRLKKDWNRPEWKPKPRLTRYSLSLLPDALNSKLPTSSCRLSVSGAKIPPSGWNRPSWPQRQQLRPPLKSSRLSLPSGRRRRIDLSRRTRPEAESTIVMGSSLGGVASLHLAWAHPTVFGRAACLSSTFGHADDLFERVGRDPKPAVQIYLDSGWPRDNYDATNAMRDRLVARGFRLGEDLLHFSFPDGLHSERSWALRVHLPFQFFLGRAWTARQPR